MKFFGYIVLFLVSFTSKVKAQSAVEEKPSHEQAPEIYTVVEEMPEYPGGMMEMAKFIQINTILPISFKDKSIGGKVFLKFVVNEDGTVSNVEVIKSSAIAEIDNIALLAVQKMPKWKPGYQNGKAVKVYFNLPVSFAQGTPYFIFNPNNNDRLYLEAKKYIERGDVSSAIANLKKSENQDDLDVLYNLGIAYYLRNKMQDACDCFKKITANEGKGSATLTGNAKLYLSKYCSN